MPYVVIAVGSLASGHQHCAVAQYAPHDALLHFDALALAQQQFERRALDDAVLED